MNIYKICINYILYYIIYPLCILYQSIIKWYQRFNSCIFKIIQIDEYKNNVFTKSITNISNMTIDSDTFYDITYRLSNNTYKIICNADYKNILDIIKIQPYCNKINIHNKKYILSAIIDRDETDISDIIQQYAGPIGDFYKHADYIIPIKYIKSAKLDILTHTDSITCIDINGNIITFT